MIRRYFQRRLFHAVSHRTRRCAPNLIFLFCVLPVLVGIAVVALAVYLIVRAIKKKKDK